MSETSDTSESHDEPPNPAEKPMGFLDHLEELRWTLMKSVGAFLVAFIVAAVFFSELAQWLRWPLDRGLAEHPEAFKAITASPMAIFSIYMTIPAIGGVIGALPLVLYFIGQFVAPALTSREKRLLIPGFAVAVLLFLAGAAFSFFVLMPSVMKISVELNMELGTELYWTIDKYYSMLMWIMIGMGAAFQFPLLIQIAVYLDLVTVEKLRSWRRIMFITCCIISAIITPTPDPFNMMLVALPLYVLYEVALLFASSVTARRAKQRQLD
jgi:sec-independent protein translocase protein TatC